MALDSNRLATALEPRIKAGIISELGSKYPTTELEESLRVQAEQQRDDLADSLAKAIAPTVAEEIITEITTNAVVDLMTGVIS